MRGDKRMGQNIRRLREKNGFTQEAVYKMTGITMSYLSQLEGGSRNPGSKTIDKLCDAFTVSEQELRFGELDEMGLDRRHDAITRMLIEVTLRLPESAKARVLADVLKIEEEFARLT